MAHLRFLALELAVAAGCCLVVHTIIWAVMQ